MTTFNEHQFEKKLQYLKDSQESIQSLSSWCLQHRQHHKKIVSIWLRVMKKVKVEHRLTLFYLANDVIQYSKRKNYEFVDSWGTALQRATPMVREDKVKHKILRIFKIWNDRGVYDDTFVSDLCGLLSTQTKKTQPEPALVETEFQSSALFNIIRSCSELDNETDTRLRKLKESPISVCDVDGICTILKDRRQGDDMVVEVDEGIGKMQAYVTALQSEIKEREQLIEQLEQAQIYYSSQYGEAKIVCNAYRNFGNRVKQLKRKLDELIPSLKDVSPLPSPDVNAPSPSPDSDIDFPEECNASKGVVEEEGFTPEGQPIKTVSQEDSHSLDNCFTSFLGNAASLPFDLQKNLFGESSPRLALTPSPIHNLLEESGELPLLSLSSTSEGKPIEVINSRSKPDEGFSISDFFKNLGTNIPGLDVDGAGESQPPSIVSKEESFSSLPGIMESLTSHYEYSSVVTTTSSSIQLADVTSHYEYSAIISTPNTVPPIPPSPVTAMDSVSRYEYSPITTPAKQQYEYPPVVMTPSAPPPPAAADVTMARYDEYVPAVSTNTIQATTSMPDVSVPRYDDYTPAITTPNVPPPPVKSNVSRYDDYSPTITTTNIPPPPAKSSMPRYDDYTPAVSTTNVPSLPVKSSVTRYDDYTPAITTTNVPPPPVKSSVTRYDDYTPAITTPNVPSSSVKSSATRYDDYTPAITTTNVLPPAVKSNVTLYDDYTPAITTPNVPSPSVKSSATRYDDYTPAITTNDVPPLPIKNSIPRYDDYTPVITTANVPPQPVKQYEAYTPTVTTTSTMQPPPPIPEMMESAISRYEYPPAVTTPTPLQPPPLPPNLFPLDKYSHDEDEDAWGSKKDVAPSWSSKLPPKFPTWRDTPMETEWTPAMPVMPLDLDTPESPPMYEKEGFSDPVEYDESGGDVDHRTLVTLQLGDIDHRSLAHVGKKDVDHRPANLRKKDVDHRNLISLTGSPLRDTPWSRADQDYRTIPKPLAAVVPESSGEKEADRDYRVPRPLGQELHDNVESVDMELSDEESLEPVAARRDVKPLLSFNITSPAKMLPNSPLHEKEETKQRAPFFSAQRIPTIGGNVRNFRSRGAGTGNNFTKPPPLPRGFRPAPLAPPPPPPAQFLNDTDRFRTLPPQLHTPPPMMKHNAPNFTNRSPIRNNFSSHTRNFSIQPTLSGPPTPTKNATLSYPNVKPLPQVKPVPSCGVKIPVSTASTPTQTERTLTQVKPQQMTPSPTTASTLSPQGTARQTTQQHNEKNSLDSTAEIKQSPSTTSQNSKPLQLSQSSKPSTPVLDFKTTTMPESPQAAKQQQSPENSEPTPSLSQPAHSTRSPTTQHSSFSQSSCNPPSFASEPPTAPTSPSVQNITKSPPFDSKSISTPTSPVQNVTKQSSQSVSSGVAPTSPVHDTTKSPPFGTRPPAVSTSSAQSNAKIPPFGIRPPSLQNTRPPPFGSRPPPFGNRPPHFGNRPPPFGNRPPPFGNRPSPFCNRPPLLSISLMQNRQPYFGTKPPVVSTSMQNTAKPPPPLLGTKPHTTPTSPLQNTTKPSPFGSKSPTTPASPVQNITKPPLFNTKPPAMPTSSVNTTKPPPVGNKPPASPTSVQNAMISPLVSKQLETPTSPVKDSAKSPPFDTNPQSQPSQNTIKPLLGGIPQAAPQSEALQNAADKVSSTAKPPAISTLSQNSATEPAVGNKPVMVADPADSCETRSSMNTGSHVLDIKPAPLQMAKGSNVNLFGIDPAIHVAMKRDHEEEFWMNDDFPYFESEDEVEDEVEGGVDMDEDMDMGMEMDMGIGRDMDMDMDMDLEPKPKVQGLSWPRRGRGRGLLYAPRMRPPQWHGPRRSGPPLPRYQYRPPPPLPLPRSPLLGLRPTRPYHPMFRGRPRGRW